MLPNKNKLFLKTLLTFVISTVSTLLMPVKIFAISAIEAGVLSAKSDSQPADIIGANGLLTTISNTLLFAIGALSVLMIIVGGIRYVISGGKEANVTKAKNTVLYAIIGLIIAILAYAIINFVLNTLAPGMSGGGTNV
jgi:hypothetical protein